MGWKSSSYHFDKEWIKETTGDNDLASGKHLTIPWPVKGKGREELTAVATDKSLSNK